MIFQLKSVLLETPENQAPQIEHNQIFQLSEYNFKINDTNYYMNNQIHLINNHSEPSILSSTLIAQINNSLEALAVDIHPIQPYMHDITMHNNNRYFPKYPGHSIIPILPEDSEENSTLFKYRIIKTMNRSNLSFYSDSIFILSEVDVDKDYEWVDQYFNNLFQTLVENISSI